ncbi:MAG: hypothetical protein HXX18_07030 [Bacteroidetes bacterium]|nr:hypothetical protein [Bacteroidota bacterium]
MKKLSIFVLLLTTITCFASKNNIAKPEINQTNSADGYYSAGYYDKESGKIVITHEITRELSDAYNKLSQRENQMSATLNSIDILDNNPTDLKNLSYYCNYGNTSEGSFNVALELLKIERDNKIFYIVDYKSNGGNSVTHTCTGVKCESCRFTLGTQGEINGCECVGQKGHCNHTISSTSGGGNSIDVAAWAGVLVGILSWFI